MRRNRWKAGPAPEPETVLVSATRFRYARWRHMPAVWWHGWRLRHRWGSRAGSVGLLTAVELRRPVTYSLSVWESRGKLGEFMRAPEHLALIRAFRGRLAESASVTWETSAFAPEPAWQEGLERLAARGPAAVPTDPVPELQPPSSAAGQSSRTS